jgi:hypothetical protein
MIAVSAVRTRLHFAHHVSAPGRHRLKQPRRQQLPHQPVVGICGCVAKTGVAKSQA